MCFACTTTTCNELDIKTEIKLPQTLNYCRVTIRMHPFSREKHCFRSFTMRYSAFFTSMYNTYILVVLFHHVYPYKFINYCTLLI